MTGPDDIAHVFRDKRKLVGLMGRREETKCRKRRAGLSKAAEESWRKERLNDSSSEAEHGGFGDS